MRNNFKFIQSVRVIALACFWASSSWGYSPGFVRAELDIQKEAAGIVTDSKDSTQRLILSLEAQGSFTSGNKVPFWMQSNRFGSVPLDGLSSGWIGRLEKPYTRKNKFDWSAGVEGRLNAGNKVEGILTEAYIKARLGIFELKAGRTKDQMGLTDSTLSAGAFAVSGNALGLPKVELAIPEFWTVPIWEGIFAFKGNFAFGTIGYTPLVAGSTKNFIGTDIAGVKSLYQQKSFYGRLGKAHWPVKFYAGFNHQTVYGNEAKIYNRFNLNKIESFLYAFSGKTWESFNGSTTKLGNQLGSIDFGLTYDLKSVTLFAYRQQIYDVGALAYLANVRDGLTGLSLTNKSDKPVRWTKILFEVLYTKNQAGETWSRPVPSGDEAYYNNFMYQNGWSYKGRGIGNPFITPRHQGRDGLAFTDGEYFLNNRVVAFHTGLEALIKSTSVRLKLSYSKNYGTYLTEKDFGKLNQFSGYVELNRILQNNWQVGISTAIDSGQLLYNSVGVMASVRKTLVFR